ncbi:MAG: SRPBCC family protein [Gaiellaceae bacterium]
MAITHSIEINRRPEDVFAYIDDLARHGEWQEQIVSVQVDTEGPTRVGSKATEVRKIGGREQTMSYEITEHDPPRSFAFRGLDGPLRPVGRGTIEPVGDASSRVSIEFDFETHGLAGKALKPIATGQARKEIAKNQEKLKERLESGAA